MLETLRGRAAAIAETLRAEGPAFTLSPPPASPPAPPDPVAGPEEGCRFIAADVDWRRWRYCGQPVRRGAWCAAHDAAVHRWPGLADRQRLGEEIIRQLATGGTDDRA